MQFWMIFSMIEQLTGSLFLKVFSLFATITIVYSKLAVISCIFEECFKCVKIHCCDELYYHDFGKEYVNLN